MQFRSAQVVNSWTLETHWTVGASTLPYTCDAILVYELTEDQETLLQSYPVRCRSEVSGSGEQQSQLQLSVKLNDKMKSDRLYRLCLVLFERASDQEASLLPGCSHSMNWLTLSQSDSIRSDHSDEDVSWVPTILLSVSLSVCLTPFNSETVADMDKFSKANPP